MENTSRFIAIPSRFRGPSTSGNGGYTCGIVASFIEGAAEVTLRRPPPIERPLTLEHGDGVVLRDGENVVAHGKPSRLDLTVPQPPSFEEAQVKTKHYRGFEGHPFPECFVCGPARTEGEGLRIFAGRKPGESVVAAPWVPDASMCDARGRIDPRIVWAALDCPGYFAVETGDPAVLGMMAAEITGDIHPGERCVVIGWPLGQEGRKLYTATALFSEAGEVTGRSSQTWVKLRV
jgi:hypothetical protein